MRVVVVGRKTLLSIIRDIGEGNDFGISLLDSVPLIFCHSREIIVDGVWEKRTIKWRDVISAGDFLAFQWNAPRTRDVGTFYTVVSRHANSYLGEAVK